MGKKILIVCTSADKLTEKIGTGSWMEEVAAPYFVFTEKGHDVTIASINGGEIPFDESSLEKPYLTTEAEKFMLDDECMKLVTASKKLADVDVSEFDAIFMPGGHGTCVDFPGSAELAKALEQMWDAGKVVSAVCHGPTAFASTVGEKIIKGKKVTGFSNDEENAVNKELEVPFLLEDKLKELGGLYEKAVHNWGVHTVRDGNLVTGQNPGSSAATAHLILEALAA